MDKTIKRALGIIIFATLMMTSFSCGKNVEKAGEEFVDTFCDSFKEMTDKVETTTSVEELANIDYERIIARSGLEDIDDACESYKLTKQDKKRMSRAVEDFVDAGADKIYSLTGGLSPKSGIKNAMLEYINPFLLSIRKSKTVGELINEIERYYN